jgi:hypothetical protein
MQCFICGGPMRVAMVEPHVVDMQGFVGCGDVEKRPFLDSARSLRPAPVAVAPAPSNKVKAILGGLVRLRGGTPNL